MKKRKKDIPVYIVLISIVSLLSLLAVGFLLAHSLSKNEPLTTSAKAEGNDCDLCINEPSCCAEIASTHDAHACDWPTRGWCKPSTCGQIEGKGERCGWYWIWHNANDNDYKLGTNSPNGYGCMIGPSESTMQPRCTPAGAITLAPTSPIPPPTVIPTSAPLPTIPPSQPTQEPEKPTPEPTTMVRVPPNEPPPRQISNAFQVSKPESVTQQLNFPSIQFPHISFPKVNINLVKINQSARKPLNFFEYLFGGVVYFDSLLEKSVNDGIDRFFK